MTSERMRISTVSYEMRLTLRKSRSFSVAPYLAFNARLVHNLVNVVGGDARLGRSSRKVEDLARELTNLAHGFYALGVQNVKLVAVGQRATVLGVAILGPHGVRDRLGNGSVLGQRVDRSQGP